MQPNKCFSLTEPTHLKDRWWEQRDRFQRVVIPPPLSTLIQAGKLTAPLFEFYTIPAAICHLCGWCRCEVLRATFGQCDDELAFELVTEADGRRLADLTKIHNCEPLRKFAAQSEE